MDPGSFQLTALPSQECSRVLMVQDVVQNAIHHILIPGIRMKARKDVAKGHALGVFQRNTWKLLMTFLLIFFSVRYNRQSYSGRPSIQLKMVDYITKGKNIDTDRMGTQPFLLQYCMSYSYGKARQHYFPHRHWTNTTFLDWTFAKIRDAKQMPKKGKFFVFKKPFVE